MNEWPVPGFKKYNSLEVCTATDILMFIVIQLLFTTSKVAICQPNSEEKSRQALKSSFNEVESFLSHSPKTIIKRTKCIKSEGYGYGGFR